ncbi:hydrogenase [Bradyrhizobium sp. 137]|uniref:hydrogenase n=1 Tax=Bradyrhizobium sp. 137 TaxID=2782614 RepID=UPI001FFBE705|nr:hydrogenase [Bradyrhizobium sp. 137]
MACGKSLRLTIVAKLTGLERAREQSNGTPQARFALHGMFLFLVGLLTGLVETNLNNPRMGLAAHLEGVMNGTFLVALGAIWSEVILGPPQKTVAYWTVLYGTYANWAVTTLAAIWGTAAMSPITATGHSAQPWQEAVVTVGFVSVGLSILTATILVLWGLRNAALREPSSENV